MRKKCLVLGLVFACCKVWAYVEDKSIYCPKLGRYSTTYDSEDRVILSFYNFENVLFSSEPINAPYVDSVIPRRFIDYDYVASKKKLSCGYLTISGDIIYVHHEGKY